ncbi:Adenosylcobinamide amidohydrolase [Melghirimyces algeriensis]|uniref:Adenosylcobinamide amidohydrolase n=1 Tax=Melghirimyces algeriensis TaxID=910412 RepID=A0A521DPT9_9BACL|nr:adenosylcobinamide amidohydrolase [Melghirimyces algeriensis]SMO73632.1 Adenosylcobinamide amidohydrolase [Melghirimyces algeriensis]
MNKVKLFSRTLRLLRNKDFILHIGSEYLCLKFPRPLQVLSSSFFGGGEWMADTIINRHVSKNYHKSDPALETEEWLTRCGYNPETTVAMMTAAKVEKAVIAEERSEEGGVAAIVTAGVSNAARAGIDGPVYRMDSDPGTINMILLIDGQVTSGSMVNAVITAVEAKVAALQDLGVTDAMGNQATGTTTDAVVIAATQEAKGGFLHTYAGTASPLGRLVGLTVYRALTGALRQSGSLKGETWP